MPATTFPTFRLRQTQAVRNLGSVALMLTLTSMLCAAANPPTLVVQWNNAALQGDRDSAFGPPMVARALAMVHTCIYDAWAAYDERAVGTQLQGALRRPASERTLAGCPTLSGFVFCLPFRNCGCPALAFFARAGTMLPIA